MAAKALFVVVGLVLGTAFAFGQDGQASSSVAISVLNEAGVPEADLRKAEQFATAVYQRAGIEVRWLNHPGGSRTGDACEELPGQMVCVVVTIVSKSTESTGDVLGEAFSVANGMGKFANVFYGRVQELGNRQLSSAGVLGFVIAHETGHILLGANSHSGLGIMQPCWASPQLRKASMGNLLFTPEQAERMRERIRVTSRKKVEMAMRRGELR